MFHKRMHTYQIDYVILERKNKRRRRRTNQEEDIGSRQLGFGIPLRARNFIYHATYMPQPFGALVI